MRFSLVRCTRRAGADLPGEYRRYRFCGVLLVLMNAALAGVVVLVLHRGGGFRYSGFMIYAMAAYAFYATIAGVVNLVRYRRYNSPVLTASRAVSHGRGAAAVQPGDKAGTPKAGPAGARIDQGPRLTAGRLLTFWRQRGML